MSENQKPCTRTPKLSRAFRGLRRFGVETGAGPIVEFAIIVPVLLLLVLGAIDLGRAFFQKNNLVSAVREGARFAAVQANVCSAATQTAIRNRVRGYFSSVGDSASAPANTAAAIPVSVLGTNPCTTGQPTSITVGIATYTYTPLTPIFALLNRAGTINLTASANYRWERAQ